MGETTDKIESQIASTREDLGANLQELEQKVKSVTDWRQHFQSNPMTMIGVAFGGGVLLATLAGSNRSRSGRRGISGASEQTGAAGRQAEAALATWDHIKGALIGVAAARFKSFVGEMVPGFDEQFDKASGANSPAPFSPASPRPVTQP